MPFDPNKLAAARGGAAPAAGGGFDPAKLAAAKGPGLGERVRAGAESFLKTPALPAIAGTAVGLATSGASPLVGAPAAALAGGAGEAVRQLGLRAVSSKQQNFLDQGNPDVPQTMGESAALIGRRAAEQGVAELGGRAIGAVAKVVGKGLAEGGQGLTKIPAQSFERIFKNPQELFTAPFKSTISKAYGKVGFLADGTLEQAAKDATTSNAGFIRTAIKEMDKPFTQVNPKKLFQARKAVDAEMDIIKFAGGPKANRSAVKEKLANLETVRKGINEALDILAEGGMKDAVALRAADKLAAKGAAANDFRALAPRVNVMQSVPRAATAPLVIPAVAGGITAAAGAAAKTMPFLGRGALSAGAAMSDVLLDRLKNRKK